MLVIGPNSAFLNHIGRVLPSLGESDVVFMTTGDLVPGLHVTAEDAPEAARLKGSLKMLDVLAAAIADRQRLPEQPMPIDLADVTVRIDAETARVGHPGGARERPPAQRGPRGVHRHRHLRADRTGDSPYRPGLADPRGQQGMGAAAGRPARRARRQRAFTAAVDELWPILTPEIAAGELYSSPERLRAAGADAALLRADGDAWTVSDVPLLDELVDLLGRDKPADDSAERERKAEAEYAAGVLDLMVSREDLMADEDHLLATDLLYAEDLADRFVERDTRELAERAAADRDWTYRHVVVDEAQELSEMDWRVLMRRCPSRSFTVVGDLAQRRSAAGATSWDTMLEPYVPGRWVYRSLSVNYRTPAEIMSVAAALLAEFAPDVQPPESVRATGVQPWSRQSHRRRITLCDRRIRPRGGRRAKAPAWSSVRPVCRVRCHRRKPRAWNSTRCWWWSRSGSSPTGPRGAAELYVALTRATQRLGVLHSQPSARRR